MLSNYIKHLKMILKLIKHTKKCIVGLIKNIHIKKNKFIR